MRDCTQWSLKQQVQCLRKQYAQHGGLPFADVLSENLVLETLKSLGVKFNNSLYNPVVTLWIFLTQAINADNVRTEFDADGNAVRTRPCHGTFRTPAADDCKAPTGERAWSSPIFVDLPTSG